MKNSQVYRLPTNSSVLILIMHLLFACSSGSTSLTELEIEEDSSIQKSIYARPLRDVKFKITPQRIARGKYLTEGPLWCFNCHTERDTTKAGWPPFWDKKGSGALLRKTDSTYLYAPNITPDKKTGIADFTDDMIARAIREGVGHDDRVLSDMPWWTFRELTDEDVASVVSYLRTMPAIENKIPRRKLGQKSEEDLKKGSFPIQNAIEILDLSNSLDRGKYLIGISDCIGCHTGWYKRNPGVFGGGNPMDHNKEHIFSSNISSDITGVGAWPAETFIYVMKNGKGKSGSLNGQMPWVSFKNMSDEDLEAIYQALLTTYPVKHIVQNGVAPTHCEVCGLEHGLGDQNKIEPIKPYKSETKTPADIAGIYVGPLFPDTLRVDLNKIEIILKGLGTEWKLVPINSTEFMAEGLPAPIHFVRDSNGKVTELQYSDLGRSFKKVVTLTAGK